MRTANLVSAWITAALIGGCSGGSKDNDGLVHKDGGLPSADTNNPLTSIFKIFEVPECGQAGYQTVAAAGAGKVAFATLAATSKTASCLIEARTQVANVYDVCVVVPSAAGFSGSIVTSQPYTVPMGVGLAFDKAGELALAYTGGPSASLRCGASDMLVASLKGGTLGAPQTIAAGSQSNGMPADQQGSCAAQDVCNRGDATGYWPSMALDPLSGNFGVAFRDLHFGFADTDFASSDVEFALGPGYSVFTVDVARGGGTYNRLAFSPTGMAAVAHYSLDYKPALWLDWQTAAGWKSQKLYEDKIGEQLGFAISNQGLYALAYFESKRQMLYYRESSDGSTWTAAETVDSDGIVGNFTSLAFDSQGNPAIAYYRCNDYGASGGCNTEKDGLYLARRLNGVWISRLISGESKSSEGMYTALAFMDGKAVIAFQTSYFDPVAGASKVGLSVAKEM